jgi:hypothetical protein
MDRANGYVRYYVRMAIPRRVPGWPEIDTGYRRAECLAYDRPNNCCFAMNEKSGLAHLMDGVPTFWRDYDSTTSEGWLQTESRG